MLPSNDPAARRATAGGSGRPRRGLFPREKLGKTNGGQMYKRIMVPLDIAHAKRFEKALATAAELGRTYEIPVVYVGVAPSVPTSVAHSPAEFKERLSKFAEAQGQAHGIQTEVHTTVIADPTVELDKALLRACKETGADLVVMGSHIPNLADHIWPSHGGWLASHAPVSVFIVRG
jgi:nucleotide-binding universal stress UspA family protein